MIVLFSHVRTGRWASVMPEKLAETLGLTEAFARFRSSNPRRRTDRFGGAPREPMTPLTALVAEARRIAASFGLTPRHRLKF